MYIVSEMWHNTGAQEIKQWALYKILACDKYIFRENLSSSANGFLNYYSTLSGLDHNG